MLTKLGPDEKRKLDTVALATKKAYSQWLDGDAEGAKTRLRDAIDASGSKEEKGWLLTHLAAFEHATDPAQAQKILVGARKQNSSVLKPIAGMGFTKLKLTQTDQANAAKEFMTGTKFLENDDRILWGKWLVEDLRWDEAKTNEFEAAIGDLAKSIGVASQRPDKELGEGPDNLWGWRSNNYFVIECKSGATSTDGIKKSDLGQLQQAMSWFVDRYTGAPHAIPLMVHPLQKIGPHGSPVPGMRVISEKQLQALRKAFMAYCQAFSDSALANDLARIAKLLEAHGFTASLFVDRYTVQPKA